MDGWTCSTSSSTIRRRATSRSTSSRRRTAQTRSRAGASPLEKPVTAEALDEAFAELASFIERRVKRLLVVDDDEVAAEGDRRADRRRRRRDRRRRLERGGARGARASSAFDCVVLDLKLPT